MITGRSADVGSTELRSGDLVNMGTPELEDEDEDEEDPAAGGTIGTGNVFLRDATVSFARLEVADREREGAGEVCRRGGAGEDDRLLILLRSMGGTDGGSGRRAGVRMRVLREGARNDLRLDEVREGVGEGERLDVLPEGVGERERLDAGVDLAFASSSAAGSGGSPLSSLSGLRSISGGGSSCTIRGAGTEAEVDDGCGVSSLSGTAVGACSSSPFSSVVDVIAEGAGLALSCLARSNVGVRARNVTLRSPVLTVEVGLY